MVPPVFKWDFDHSVWSYQRQQIITVPSIGGINVDMYNQLDLTLAVFFNGEDLDDAIARWKHKTNPKVSSLSHSIAVMNPLRHLSDIGPTEC